MFFHDPSLRIRTNKTKINKWDLTNIKAFAQQMTRSVKEKKRTLRMEKILANKNTHREFIINTYKQLTVQYQIIK